VTEVLFYITNEYNDSIREKQPYATPDDRFLRNTALMELTAELARASRVSRATRSPCGEARRVCFRETRDEARRGELHESPRLVLISETNYYGNSAATISLDPRGIFTSFHTTV
jgi:hypothetical protein